MARTTLFVDTGYVIALVSPRDRYHDAAVEWAARIKRENILLLTSRAVQLEFGAALARPPWRSVHARTRHRCSAEHGRTFRPGRV